MIPIIIGIFFGIITIITNTLTHTLTSSFIENFIIFGSVYFLVVFLYFSLKIGYTSFIQKSPLKFFTELIFIGLFGFIYCILIYYFRGIPPNINILYFSLLFIIAHILLELSHSFKNLNH
jgi:hypothetical protein